MNHDSLTFYKSGLLKQKWRWRYQAAGNNKKLANGGEAYSSRDAALKSAFRVMGLGNPYDFIAGRLYVDTLLTRDNGFDVMVRFRY